MLSVAIDGPAGVGKSTVAKKLAQKLGWKCLDTGALYRAVCFALLKLGVDLSDKNKVIQSLKEFEISIKFIDNKQHTFLNDEDITSYLRSQEIDIKTPIISAYPEVRQSVVELQRKEAEAQNLVVEGRDIGSNVLKDSKNKFYLDASPEERANRRYKERLARGEQASFETIFDDIMKRDKIDMTRTIAPLVCASDAIKIDTTKMTIEEVVQFIYDEVSKRLHWR